jgi:hypothetical protein
MKGKMTINETWPAITERLARLLQAHHRYVTLVANPRDGQSVAPFTQVAWRDDCSMQLEAVSDQFLDYFLDDEQCKLLSQLGYANSDELNDERDDEPDDGLVDEPGFVNYVQFRVGEGTEPLSVAELLVRTLRDVYRVEIAATDFEYITSDEKFNLAAALAF